MFKCYPAAWRHYLHVLLTSGALCYSTATPALGLGEISLHSALNQPLVAEIALLDAQALAEGELSVGLAIADEFNRAGIERVGLLNDLRFTPVLRGERSVIRVTSNKPVNEPFLNFLLQLDQPQGRVVREYTVLIDPPGSPGIVPLAGVEPVPVARSPAEDVVPAQSPVMSSSDGPGVVDPTQEQLAASVLQNQQLQLSIDELRAGLQTRDDQIARQHQQFSELQAQLAEARQPRSEAVAPLPVAVAPLSENGKDSTPWRLIALSGFGGLLLLGLFLRHQRRQVADLPEPDVPHQPLPVIEPRPLVERSIEPIAPDTTDRLPLKNDDLSMDLQWELVNPFDSAPDPARPTAINADR